MNVLIISAPFYRQADTVLDSLYAFGLYGNMNYKTVFTVNGDLAVSLESYDVVILHYSLIKFPFRYHLPISPDLSIKLRLFTGVKLAMVQDEQRSCMERLQFLNGIKLNHLFSVAPSDVIETLYPARIRNFSVSTILTGYVTNRLLSNWDNSRSESHRALDAVYRGRVLPDWYGDASLLKNDISSEILKVAELANLRVDVSSKESARIYGDNWLNFLRTGYVAVGTPSGSGRLDIYGKYPESFVPSLPQHEVVDSPINADYFVISPKIFEYISSNCLLALTSGRYSEIAIENRHFLTLSDDAENLPEIVEFANSKSGERMRQKCVEEILFNESYHISSYVVLFEEKILSYLSKTNGFYVNASVIEVKGLSQRVKSEFQDSLSSRLKRRLRVATFFFQNCSSMFAVLGLLLSWRMIKGLTQRKLDWNFLEICFFMARASLLSPLINFTVTKINENHLEIAISDPQLYQNVYFKKSDFKQSAINLNLGGIDLAYGFSSDCNVSYFLVEDLILKMSKFNQFDQP